MSSQSFGGGKPGARRRTWATMSSSAHHTDGETIKPLPKVPPCSSSSHIDTRPPSDEPPTAVLPRPGSVR